MVTNMSNNDFDKFKSEKLHKLEIVKGHLSEYKTVKIDGKLVSGYQVIVPLGDIFREKLAIAVANQNGKIRNYKGDWFIEIKE